MSYQTKFPTTLPIDIHFVNAESVSPIKLNNIFNYIKVASYSIEMFLGNGIDYGATNTAIDLSKRKVISNLANVIGDVSGNIYSPNNLLDNMYSLYKQWFSTFGNLGSTYNITNEHASYNSEEDSILIKQDINIPILRSFEFDVQVGIIYSIVVTGGYDNTKIHFEYSKILENDTITTVSILNNSTIPSMLFNNNELMAHASSTLSAGEFLSHLSFKNTLTSGCSIKIHSLYITADNDVVVDSKKLFSSSLIKYPYNTTYSISKYDDNKFICKLPCKWSDSLFNTEGELCPHATVTGMCIGNTYDIYVDNNVALKDKTGRVLCGSALEIQAGGIDPSIKPTRTYSTDYTGLTENRPSYYVFQSPLFKTKKQKLIKYVPILMTSVITPEFLQTGTAFIYDTKSTSGNPIIDDVSIKTSTRHDIVAVYPNLKTLFTVSDRYLFLSSEMSMSIMLSKMLEITQTINNRSTSVYAD